MARTISKDYCTIWWHLGSSLDSWRKQRAGQRISNQVVYPTDLKTCLITCLACSKPPSHGPPQSADKGCDLGALYKLSPIFITALLPTALFTPNPQPNVLFPNLKLFLLNWTQKLSLPSSQKASDHLLCSHSIHVHLCNRCIHIYLNIYGIY